MTENIGERIRLLRQVLGQTQREFASKIGIGEKTLRNYESGKFTPKEAVLRTIEQTFNVNPEWLRHGRGEMFVEREEKQEDVLLELFEAMEQLEEKVPRAVKKAIQRMYETQDVRGLIEIFTDYLYDIAENATNEYRAGKRFKGNYIKKGNMNVQLYKEGKDEKR